MLHVNLSHGDDQKAICERIAAPQAHKQSGRRDLGRSLVTAARMASGSPQHSGAGPCDPARH